MNRGHQLDEIDRLRAENERLRAALDATDTADNLAAELGRWKSKAVAEATAYAKKCDEVERLRGLNEYLETRLQDRMVALEDLATENERLQRPILEATIDGVSHEETLAENERLREELREVRVLISDYWEPEVERLRGLVETVDRQRIANGDEVEKLRKEHEYMTVKTAQYDDMVTENERLREEIIEARESRDQHFAGRQHNAREVERLRTEITGLREDDEAKQVKVERLRAALRDMLNVSPQSYDWYQGAARAALNEGKALVEERSRVIDERDAYDGSGA